MEGIEKVLQKKILIVEDEEVNRRILSRILEAQYEIITAENGQAALDYLMETKDHISLILLDIVMPVMNGYTFLEKIKENTALSQIPVVIETQQGGTKEELKALTAGANDFITKPYEPNIVRHRIDNLIRMRESIEVIHSVKWDRLTGVYSKEYFYQQVKELITSDTSVSYDIVCSDIVSFKLINDMFGTQKGDAVLSHIGKTLTTCIGERGIYGYLGNDHFAFLLERLPKENKELLYTILDKINEYPINHHIDMKFGIYHIEDCEEEPAFMCDWALLAIKNIKGKYKESIAVYDEVLRKNLYAEQLILENMEEAIAQHQFQVYLQPKYNIKNEKINGAEALVRWIHPEHGFMSPGSFIPLFEKNGFITQLDYYVWEEVCRIQKACMEEGLEMIPISVNVSRADIYNLDLPEVMVELTSRYGINPKYLHLEITESAYTENQKQIIAIVGRLRQLGFVIEMDDFGSGYSSLSMLSELPIDVLKLDMTFIQNELKKDGSRSILSFIISLAKWMNLQVIAEGVETIGQVKQLRDMDCRYVQGYYFGKPMPNQEFWDKFRNEEVDHTQQAEDLFHTEVEVTHSLAYAKEMLIIDDIELNRAILKEVFADHFTIVEAGDGQAGLAYARAHTADIAVILLDLVMPIMDGFQFLEKVKQESILDGIPIIVTSQGGGENEVRALHLGAVDYIAKPYCQEIIMRRVECALAYEAIKNNGKK